VLGVIGIIIGRKTKTATDELCLNDLKTRVGQLEQVQSEHVISIARFGQNIIHSNRAIACIQADVSMQIQMTAEIRGMLYAMRGQPIPPMPQRSVFTLPDPDEELQ
jgi:hypothetical protein